MSYGDHLDFRPRHGGLSLALGTLAVIVCACFGSCLLGIPIRRSTTEARVITVERRERVVGQEGSGKYLVWTPGEVFSVEDSLVFGTWDASDRYGRLREGHRCSVSVSGWRVPVLSMYRNIHQVHECSPPERPAQ